MDSPIGVLKLSSDEWQLKSISFDAEHLEEESNTPDILIETQKQQAQASLQKAEDLFNSLLQRAFKGELVS